MSSGIILLNWDGSGYSEPIDCLKETDVQQHIDFRPFDLIGPWVSYKIHYTVSLPTGTPMVMGITSQVEHGEI